MPYLLHRIKANKNRDFIWLDNLGPGILSIAFLCIHTEKMYICDVTKVPHAP